MGNNLGFDAFPGYAGVSFAIAFSNLGAAYGMAKSGSGVSGMGVRKPDLIIRTLLPVVMASILGVYGMIVSVVILKNMDMEKYNYL